MPRAEAPTEGPPEPDEPCAYCPRCDARLVERRCKLLCPQCGYYMSCADPY